MRTWKFLALAVVLVSLAAAREKLSREWMTGILIDVQTDRGTGLAGGTSHRNDVMYYTIDDGSTLWELTRTMTSDDDRALAVTVNSSVHFAIDGGRALLKDEDGVEHTLAVNKKVAKPPTGKASSSAGVRAATGGAPEADKQATKDEAQIRQLFVEWQRAFEAGDLDGVMRLYAPEEAIVRDPANNDLVAFDVVPPIQYVGRAAYRQSYANFFARFEHPPKISSLDNMRIVVGKDMAVAHGSERITGVAKGGAPMDVTLRWTEVFRKFDGRWFVVHEHVSVPVDFERNAPIFDAK
ncbi:MAG: nuclear transport factor 2 family protein [Acidobacteriota bacterium]|nr:nuclear transport factor 2 family protein [Acidobacteriota bacterium]